MFTISFEYFKQFCYETNYMWGKGRTKNAFSVDRIIEELGYIEGNEANIEKQIDIGKFEELLELEQEGVTELNEIIESRKNER